MSFKRGGGSAPLRRFGWGFRPPATVWMGVPPSYDGLDGGSAPPATSVLLE